MKRSTVIAIAASCCVVAVALAQPNGSSRAATNAAQPTPVVSVTTLPALPSPGAPTAHPVTPPSAAATNPLPSSMSASPFGSPHATPTAPPATIAPPPPGTLITITGAVTHPLTISLDQLRDMHKTSITMRVIDADGKHRFHTFAGTPLKAVLNLAVPSNPGGADTSVNAYALITGLSGGPAIVAFPEFENDFANKTVLLAYQVNGKPVKIGSVMLVVDGDATVGRFVQGVTSIQIIVGGP